MLNVTAAAQAIEDAYNSSPPCNDHVLDHKQCLAAALRAAADQVVPLPRLPYDSCCDISASAIRAELLGIAAELEGDGPAVSDDREPASVNTQPSDEEVAEEGPSDEALIQLACNEELGRLKEDGSISTRFYYPKDISENVIAFARAVLAHWGRPAPLEGAS